ncbi:hypothetical protein [Ilumatobacter sp.]|uniref:hypothetical protein n=1 Tax=Ilumatobacter sp. TaxID=1967498 RepID=UPI0037504A05
MEIRAELEWNLKIIKDTLAASDTSASETASLLRERRITLNELEGLGAARPGSITDEVKGRREKRNAAAIARATKSS